MPGNAPLNPDLHSVQDALHAAHKTSQKGHNGAVILPHKKNTAPSLGALEHQKLRAPPPNIAKLQRTSEKSGEETPGELLERKTGKVSAKDIYTKENFLS